MNELVSNPNTKTKTSIEWLVIFANSCRIIVGLVFLTAGILKSFDPAGFAYQIDTYGIIPGQLSSLASIIIILVEVILGISLIINYHSRIALPLVGILILTFIAANIWAWSQGKTEGCGCFGNFADRTPGEVLVEDLLLLVGSAIAWVRERRVAAEHAHWKNWTVVAGCLFAIALPFIGPYLPVDSFVTKLKVGADLGDLSVSDIDFDLGEGEYLVVLLGQDCSQCEGIVENLNLLAESGEVPEVIGILVGNRNEVVEFWFKYGATFALGYAPREEVGNLYRKLPRSFLMVDGIVKKVWDDSPPSLNEFRTYRKSVRMR